jgi:1,4-dihydroxy-2-naphthoyl-CoA synthase
MADRFEIDTGTGELLAEIRDRVAILTLNRPEARNALSDHLTPALRRMIKRFGDEAEVGAILITGAGTAFCAGGDVKGMGQGSTKAEMTFEQRVASCRSPMDFQSHSPVKLDALLQISRSVAGDVLSVTPSEIALLLLLPEIFLAYVDRARTGGGA